MPLTTAEAAQRDPEGEAQVVGEGALAYGFDKMVGERVLGDIGDYCDAQAEPHRAPQ
jgi:hypothetical protein